MTAKLSPAEIIADYRSAYFAANLKDSDQVKYDRGWFKWVNDSGRVHLSKRRDEVLRMISTLRYRATRNTQ